MRSDAAASSREKVRTKGGQSREVPDGRGGRAKRGEGKGGLEGWGFSRAEIFADEVKVTEGSKLLISHHQVG